MKIVIFGLSISSSWGNGHATIWRALCKGLSARGHRTWFFERDMPYYASNRDSLQVPGCTLRLYESWDEIRSGAAAELRDADAAIVTSYCPDGVAACRTVLDSGASVKAFYDLDTPVTLARLGEGEPVEYIPSDGLGDFDVVLSYTGGEALTALRQQLGARRVAPLYGSVDPEVHRPAPPEPEFAGDFSYLGTYAADRQGTLDRLFLQPARERSHLRFVIGGAQYPAEFPWLDNIHFVRHLPPSLHPAFYCSSGLTLNVTRKAMAAMGYCPSGRLFEAAACGVPVISDHWEGLDRFYTPGNEILVCRGTADVLNALSLSATEVARIAAAARERTLTEHTASNRAGELEQILDGGAGAARA